MALPIFIWIFLFSISLLLKQGHRHNVAIILREEDFVQSKSFLGLIIILSVMFLFLFRITEFLDSPLIFFFSHYQDLKDADQ